MTQLHILLLFTYVGGMCHAIRAGGTGSNRHCAHHTCPSHQQAAVGQGDPSCLLSQSQLSHVGSTPQGWKAGWFGPAPLLVPQVSS